MTKRLFSLMLAAVLVLGLFAGMSVPASAEDDIGNLFNRYFTEENFDELFSGTPVQTGSCEKEGSNPVFYQIYKVEPEKIRELVSDSSIGTQNEIFDKLRKQFPDFNINGTNLLSDLNFDFLLGDMDYYALKIYGSGEMKDYTMTSRAPWSGHITIDDTDVNMENQIIAAYVTDGVKNIGNRAFFGMDGLTLVYLGNTVTAIGEKAFETCDHLSAINFPSSLKTLGRRAFYACDYLTFVRMGACTKLTEIPDRAFCTCSRLTDITFPNNITNIGKFAFAWDHLLGTNEFALPSKLKTLETGAFAFCTHLGIIKDVRIPESTTNIGEWAFVCNFDLGKTGSLIIEPGKTGSELPLTIGTGAFAGCRALSQVDFPNRVREVGKFAFAACDTLERVSFGDRNGTSTQLVKLCDRAFVSLEATGLGALARVADAFKESGNDDEEYVSGSRTIAEAISGEATDLTGVTPLKYAAFGSLPPSSNNGIVAADDNMHSFPGEVTVWYSSPEYNKTAYGAWKSDPGWNYHGAYDGTWYGYFCEPMWVGHFHEYGDPDIVARTCTQDGKEVYTCHVWQDGKECGHVMEVITEPKTGHNSEAVKMIAADCDEEGIVYYHCSNEWCDKPDYTEVIPALGHDYENLQDYKAPTCLEAGHARGVCSRCGETVNETLPPKGHNTQYMDLVQEPTCTEAGYYQGNCPDCEFGMTHIVKQSVPALGHDWNDGVVTRPATATRDGEAIYTCRRCGITETRTIPRTAHVHDYVASVIAEASCTQTGQVRYTCSCGDEYYEELPKLEHSWDKGVVQTPATATTNGRMKYTCTVCGAYRFETIPASGGTPTFVDVPADEYYAAPVAWAVSHKPVITNGVDTTHFGPDEDCTRAQAVTFLYRAAGEPTVSGVNPFYDVHADDYFYRAVLWAVKNGITKGTSDHAFSPDEPCTRAHIVTFLWRAKQQPGVTTNRIPFTDVAVGEWYTLPVLWAVENEVTNGMGDGTFGTEKTCKRGQIVTFLYRAEKLQ